MAILALKGTAEVWLNTQEELEVVTLNTSWEELKVLMEEHFGSIGETKSQRYRKLLNCKQARDESVELYRRRLVALGTGLEFDINKEIGFFILRKASKLNIVSVLVKMA